MVSHPVVNNTFQFFRDHRRGHSYTNHISYLQTLSPKPFEAPRGREEHAKALVVFRRRNIVESYLNPNI